MLHSQQNLITDLNLIFLIRFNNFIEDIGVTKKGTGPVSTAAAGNWSEHNAARRQLILFSKETHFAVAQ